MMSSVSWAYLEESTVVADQPVQLFGVHVNSGTGGSYVADQPVQLFGVHVNSGTGGSYIDVYNGQDADSGERVSRIKVAANLTWAIVFPLPLICGRGLYIEFGTNIDNVTVLWSPTGQ